MRVLAALVACIFIANADAANACARVGPPTEEITRRQVEQSLSDSDVLVEAVVEQLHGPAGATVLRTLRLWKGPRERTFHVTMFHSCNGHFSRRDVGRRVRVALWRTGDLYSMILPWDVRRYQHLLDRALRRMTPYTP